VVECQLPKLNVAGSSPVTRFQSQTNKSPWDIFAFSMTTGSTSRLMRLTSKTDGYCKAG
jgi:hypothetical protein